MEGAGAQDKRVRHMLADAHCARAAAKILAVYLYGTTARGDASTVVRDF